MKHETWSNKRTAHFILHCRGVIQMGAPPAGLCLSKTKLRQIITQVETERGSIWRRD